MTNITPFQYNVLRTLCKNGRHKFSTNSFGVTFCVRCGLLSNADAPKLKEGDKLVVIK